MTYETIRYESSEKVLTITLDRPERRNTVTYQMLDELLDAFDRAEADDDVRVIVVTGQGEFFSAGTDLGTGSGGFEAGAADFKPLRGGDRDVGGELALKLFASNKVLIGAVNGTAVGIGVTMILPMDIRIAADSARFGLPFTRRGIIPESCSTWFLPRLVGIARAVEWAVTGRIFPASEALAGGLVGELAADEVVPRARALAREIATTTSAVSVALTRRLLWRQLGSPHPMSANQLESEALLAVGRGADVREGVASFKEKRQPEFAMTLRDLPDFVAGWHEPDFHRPLDS